MAGSITSTTTWFGARHPVAKRQDQALPVRVTRQGVANEDHRPQCAVLGKRPVVRITTDAGHYALVETFKPYLKPHVLRLREALLGQDPTNVERVMQRIPQRRAFGSGANRHTSTPFGGVGLEHAIVA